MRYRVRRTREFARVEGLPRRVVDRDVGEAWAEVLTRRYARTPTARLRTWQGFSLAEIRDCQGGFLGLPVGIGKTLLAELTARILDRKRSVLITEASLRDKTHHDRRALAKDWHLASPPPRVLSMTELSIESGETLLEALQPELIIIDEADMFANPTSGASLLLDAYITPRSKAECAVVAMSATWARLSIMNIWHILRWCLRADGIPLPAKQGEAKMWASMVDANVTHLPHLRDPGPLGRTQSAARSWVAARLRETPGVVLIDEDSCDQPLHVRVRPAPECTKIDAAYETFLLDDESPAGIPVGDPLSRYRIDSRLGAGYYEYWDPPPPDEWRDALRVKNKFVRYQIEESQNTDRPLRTEAPVLRRHRDHPAVDRWARVKHLYDPSKHTKSAWVSDRTLHAVIGWLAESDAPGIVWCGGRTFRERLQQVTRLRCYGPEGRDQYGGSLHNAKLRHRTGHSIIASWQANKKGFNLQSWRRMLIVIPPQSAKWLEQVIGRVHRAGQQHVVQVDILATSGGTYQAFSAAINEAHWNGELFVSRQKITRATIDTQLPVATATNRWRWTPAIGEEK